MARRLESADDCNTVIIWAGDKGVRWPIAGYLQRLTLRLVLVLKAWTRPGFSHHLDDALRSALSVCDVCKMLGAKSSR